MKKKPFYGYVMVVILGLMYFCSSGVILPAANVINPLMLDDPALGMSATTLSAGFSLFVVFQGIVAPLAGAVLAKRGARFTMVSGAVIFLLSSLAMIFAVSSPIGYLLFFGVLTSAGVMMAGQLPVQSTVGEWFVARRGLMMTITMIIGASAAFAAPPIFDGFIAANDGNWRSGWYICVALSITLVPIALFLVKNKPADIGQFPDGIDADGAAAGKAADYKVYKNASAITFSQAAHMPAFWLMSLAAAAGFAAYSFVTSQGVIHFTTLGFDRASIVLGVSVMGGVALLGKILVGSLSDRIEPIRLIGAAGILLAAATALAANAHTHALMYAYYALIGFGFGAIVTVFPTALTNYFGPKHVSKILGTGIFVTTIVASVLPIAGGAIFDATGSLVLAYYLTAVVVALCAAASFFVRVPKH